MRAASLATLVLLGAARGFLPPPPSRASPPPQPRPGSLRASNARAAEPEDFLVTDSLELPDARRPPLLAALANPRDGLALVLLGVGLAIAGANVAGAYGDEYVALERCAIALGFASAAAAAAQLATGANIRRAGRRGIADDALVTSYAGAYSAAVTWLAWRASAACPPWLPSADAPAALAAVGVFAFGVAAPLATLRPPGDDDAAAGGGGARAAPPLSATETLRVRGLLALGVLGAVFAPDCVAFALGGEAWWARATTAHPAQMTLESSTSLFALFATEASMIAHRCGKLGVAPFRTIVPAFVAVCLVLAVIPCIAALWWLGADVSFFDFYLA